MSASTDTRPVAAPTDNLVRALIGAGAAEMRAEGDGRTLFGHFAVFNQWTRIQSVFEGEFLERNAPGAFVDSITERRDRIKALYDHGHDPQLGNKPLGPFDVLEEDKRGGYYEIGLIETSYNDDFIIPAARAGLLGSSYRFSVAEGGDGWDTPMRATKWNPDKLPERTVTKADLFELGPVTFPAYQGTDVSVRSRTDEFIDHLMSDPRFLARFTERAGLTVVERLLDLVPPAAQEEREDVAPADDEIKPPADDSADGQASLSPQQQRAKYARAAYVTREGVGKRFT
jgi:HK97 family phage prohead protease